MDDLEQATLSRAFDSTADAYETGRPGYPPDAIDWWRQHGAFVDGARVLDLAAGTGKLTRALPLADCVVTAVEPLANMRHRFRSAVPGVEVVEGTAEHLAFADDSFDTVVVGQAFHWFDQPAALAEVARVLRPGGGLGLIWNDDDVDADSNWLGAVVALKRAAGGVQSIATARTAPEVVRADANFGSVAVTEVRWAETTTAERITADVVSRSYVSALDPLVRNVVAADVRAAVGHLSGGIVHPFVTLVVWATTVT